jgi:uncharacterized protein (UPF0548 family)
MPFLLGPVGDDRLAALLQAARQQQPSYGAVGATRAGEGPSGYRYDRHRVDIAVDSGQVDDAFDAGVRALQRWDVHKGAGAPVFPAGAPLAEGETVVVTLRLLPPSLVTIAAPCRVVYVTDEPDRFGFGYGTLPGHPEEGEEAFHVERTPAGVRFAIDVFWKPRHPLIRLGGPVTTYIQRRVTYRYLTALRHSVTPSHSPGGP